jgi:hypothetical protein
MRHYDSSPILHVVPFAALGLVGGILTCAGLQAFGSPEGHALLVTTPMVAALVGWGVARRRRWLLASIFFGILGGMLNGLVIGLLTAGPRAASGGMLFGAWCSLFFLPALAVVARAAHRVGRARLGSLVDLADRRAVHRAVAISIAAGSALVGTRAGVEWLGADGGSIGFLISLAAIGILAVVALGDLRACLRASEAERLTAILTRTDEPLAISSTRDPGFLDLGVRDPLGADPHYHHIVDGAGYRGTPSSRLWMTGDPATALAITRLALGVDAAALLGAVIALLLRLPVA